MGVLKKYLGLFGFCFVLSTVAQIPFNVAYHQGFDNVLPSISKIGNNYYFFSESRENNTVGKIFMHKYSNTGQPLLKKDIGLINSISPP